MVDEKTFKEGYFWTIHHKSLPWNFRTFWGPDSLTFHHHHLGWLLGCTRLRTSYFLDPLWFSGFLQGFFSTHATLCSSFRMGKKKPWKIPGRPKNLAPSDMHVKGFKRWSFLLKTWDGGPFIESTPLIHLSGYLLGIYLFKGPFQGVKQQGYPNGLG